MITAKKTTYLIEECNEPCWEVSNGYTMVRIAPCYHYIGDDIIVCTEYLDGDFNSQEEWERDFDSLDEREALEIAKRFSIYL